MISGHAKTYNGDTSGNLTDFLCTVRLQIFKQYKHFVYPTSNLNNPGLHDKELLLRLDFSWG